MGSKQLFVVAGLAGLVGAALVVAAAEMGAQQVVSAETLSG